METDAKHAQWYFIHIFVMNYKTDEYETELSTLPLATSVVVSHEESFYFMLYFG